MFCKLIVYLTIVTLCIYYNIHINQSGLYNTLPPPPNRSHHYHGTHCSYHHHNIELHFVVVTMEVYLLLILVKGGKLVEEGGAIFLFDNDAKVFSVSNIGGQLLPSV